MSRLDYEQMDIVKRAEFEIERENHARWLEKVNSHRKFVTTSGTEPAVMENSCENDEMKREEEEKEKERRQEEEREEKKKDG